MIKIKRICDNCGEYKIITFNVKESTHYQDSVHFPIKYFCENCDNKKKKVKK